MLADAVMAFVEIHYRGNKRQACVSSSIVTKCTDYGLTA